MIVQNRNFMTKCDVELWMADLNNKKCEGYDWITVWAVSDARDTLLEPMADFFLQRFISLSMCTEKLFDERWIWYLIWKFAQYAQKCTPKQIMYYQMALKVHKLLNDHDDVLSFEHLTVMDHIICTRWQINFQILRSFNSKIGMNTYANKLYLLKVYTLPAHEHERALVFIINVFWWSNLKNYSVILIRPNEQFNLKKAYNFYQEVIFNFGKIKFCRQWSNRG